MWVCIRGDVPLWILNKNFRATVAILEGKRDMLNLKNALFWRNGIVYLYSNSKIWNSCIQISQTVSFSDMKKLKFCFKTVKFRLKIDPKWLNPDFTISYRFSFIPVRSCIFKYFHHVISLLLTFGSADLSFLGCLIVRTVIKWNNSSVVEIS